MVRPGYVAYRRAAMSELRSERVIHGEERPNQGRSPVVAVVVVLGFLLAAIVGLASADSPWLPGDGSRSSAPAIVGDLLAVALAAGLCVLVALIWILTPRPTKAKPREASAIVTEEMGTSVRAGSFVLIGGLVLVAFLAIAFWFLLGNGNMTQLPPPVTTTNAAADAVPSPRRAHVHPTRLPLVHPRPGRLDCGHRASRAPCPPQASGADESSSRTTIRLIRSSGL